MLFQPQAPLTNHHVSNNNGHGVPQDFQKARELFEEAANQGFAEAQEALERLKNL